MIEDAFSAAVELIVSGPGHYTFQHLLEAAIDLSDAPVAYIVARHPTSVQVIASVGLPLVPLGSTSPLEAGVDEVFAGPITIPDLTKHPLMRESHLVTGPAAWRWFFATPVPLTALRIPVAVCCADPRSDIRRRPDLARRMHHLAVGAADAFRLLGLVAQQRRAAHDYRLREEKLSFAASLPCGEPQGVTTRFLLGTLVQQRRLLRRDHVSYHALARWRAPIKEWQVEALKELKREVPEPLVDEVASQLCLAAHEMYGEGTFQAVVPVPCGNSGPDCLAHQLARRVAAKLEVTFLEAFETIDTSGSSHPRRNAARPRMRLREAPAGPVLLIDDVATSGAHLEEASKLLRQSAPAVFPLVWIAAG